MWWRQLKPLEPDHMTFDAIQANGALAVGYVRVAAVPHTHPRSGLDAQIVTIRAFAEAEGIELASVFEDAGQSAHNKWRPGLLALMAAVDAGHANLIIVPDLTRLARDLGDLLRLMDSFARRGVRLVSANEPRGF
jgi:DNA invertase Pin-like site-specific DNA recombinase